MKGTGEGFNQRRLLPHVMNEGHVGSREVGEAGVQVEQGVDLLDAHLEAGPLRGRAAPTAAHQLLQPLRAAARLLQPSTRPHVQQHLDGLGYY